MFRRLMGMEYKTILLENRYFFIPAILREDIDTRAATKIILFEILKHQIERGLKEGLNERTS